MMYGMTIYIGSDHRGLKLKSQLIPWLSKLGHKVVDCGNTIKDPEDDNPDYAFAVTQKLTKDPQARGVLICGSGIGMSIAANRVRGIRGALGFNQKQVKDFREHDDANVIILPSDFVKEHEAKTFMQAFLETKFLDDEKYRRRIQKLDTMT